MNRNVELAMLAGSVYESSRNPDNRIPLPQDWTALRLSSWPYGSENEAPIQYEGRVRWQDKRTGFEAAAYKKDDEVVISFAGTYFEGEFSQDMLDNNLPMLLNGKVTSQLKQAAEFVARVKNDPAMAGKRITLTGHSLGGGLAALMGVFFDLPAVTFDPAPFRAAATQENATAIANMLANVPYGSGKLFTAAQLQVVRDFQSSGTRVTLGPGLLTLAFGWLGRAVNIAGGIPTTITAPDFISREHRVTAIAVQGEFLTGDAADGQRDRFRIRGSEVNLINNAARSTAGAQLHSQALLIALEASRTGEADFGFYDYANKYEPLLRVLFDTRYFNDQRTDLEGATPIEHFLRHHFGVQAGNPNGTTPIASDRMLDAIGNDLKKLGSPIAGFSDLFQEAVIGAIFRHYYTTTNPTQTPNRFEGTQLKPLLQSETGGVSFKTSDVTVGDEVFAGFNSISTGILRETRLTPAQIEYSAETALIRSRTQGERISVATKSALSVDFTSDSLSDLSIGSDLEDIQRTGAGDDFIFAGAGNDTLDGGAGNDLLIGGRGADTYQFSGQWGKDTILDGGEVGDGQGTIKIDNITLGQFKGAGKRGEYYFDLGGGQYAGLFVQDDKTSSTGKTAYIVKGTDQNNVITIKNFDEAAATNPSGNGYLGIKLGPQQLALIQGTAQSVGATATNFWSDINSAASALDGKTSTFGEGAGKLFTISLAVAAGPGAKIVLAVAGALAGSLQAILGDSTVDANGATITLTEGQTFVTFALVSDSAITADQLGSISAQYQTDSSAGNGSAGQPVVSSNSWNLTLKDAGEPDNILEGDFLAQTAIAAGHRLRYNADGEGVVVVQPGQSYFVWDSAGNLIPQGDTLVTSNAIFGGAGRDKIEGKSDADLLGGYGGNDVIDGGEGNDLIGGGAGSDIIYGGAGNDYISSTENVLKQHQLMSPRDRWELHAVPRGASIDFAHPVYGSYDNEVRGFELDYTSLQNSRNDSDVVDAGAGDDIVLTGFGSDRISAGDGNDIVEAAAGDDIIEGGDGDDVLRGDGVTASNSDFRERPEDQGSDFIDGGKGNDHITGQGNSDNLFGGEGDDEIIGDIDQFPGSRHYIDFQFHGDDYIDGEAGNDRVRGNGGNDTIYGGEGDDDLSGDGFIDTQKEEHDGDDYIDGEAGNDSLKGGAGSDALYGGTGNDFLLGDRTDASRDFKYDGQDYLDGEAGNDQLWGGGNADTLYGGEGDDVLQGDFDGQSLVPTEFQGDDYLDGEAGDDRLIGDGGNDTLYGGDGKDEIFGDSVGAGRDASADGQDYLDGGEGDDKLWGGGKADTLIGGAGNDLLQGDNNGSETIALAHHGDDYLDGGAGDDTLLGDGGNDILIGAAGDDRLFGGEGNDVLTGGAGDDSISGDDDTDSRVPGQFSGDDIIDAGEGNDIVLGGAGNDTIEGGAGNDSLFGGAGDDVISGGDGDDRISGGAGTNSLDGGAGNDNYYFKRGDGYTRITDASGFNRLYLEPGLTLADVKFSLGSLRITFAGASGAAGDEIHIEGFDPQDPLNTCAVQEIVFEETGRLYSIAQLLQERGFDLLGTPEVDYIQGTTLQDRIQGLDGSDVLEGDAGNDSLDGGKGNDYLDGGEGDDALLGGDGEDVLISAAGSDALDGGSGDDIYRISSNPSALTRSITIADAAGIDTLQLNWQLADTLIGEANKTLTHRLTGEVITLASADPQAPQNVSVIEWFEFAQADGSVQRLDWGQVFYGKLGVLGTVGADALVGSDVAEVLAGLSGNDLLQAGAGDDLLRPGSGADRLEGGAGSDRFDLIGTTGDKVIVDFSEIEQTNTLLLGWNTSDISYELATQSFVNLSTGQRVTIAGMQVAPDGNGGTQIESSIQTVVLNNGNLTLTMAQLFELGIPLRGTPQADVLQGSFLNEIIDALASDDVVNAGAGNDTVFAGAGNDVINGGTGKDAIFGGAGDDVIDGDAGADEMRGGEGADLYRVDEAGDQVIEQPAGWQLRVSPDTATMAYWLSEGYVLVRSPQFGLARWEREFDANGQVVAWTSRLEPINKDTAYGEFYTFERVSDGALRYVQMVVETQIVNADLDTVESAVRYRLPQNVENLVLLGGQDLSAHGNQASNVIQGNAGNNLLVGNALDRRFDRFGDTYSAYGLLDPVTQQPRDPRSAQEERLTQAYYRAWFEQFSTLDPNTSSLPSTLRLTRGDTLDGGAGDDTLIGSTDNDLLIGGEGNDVLIGQGGADVMRGGAGDDTYVNNPSRDYFLVQGLFGYQDESTITIEEDAGSGLDTVISLESFSLPDHVENLVLVDSLSAAHLDPDEILLYGMPDFSAYGSYKQGRGNSLDNRIVAGDRGSELFGLGGNDLLIGGAGADLLDGNEGADAMRGGQGNDVYAVDDALDTVTELQGEGQDLVRTNLGAYELNAHVEDLELTGLNNSQGTGNALANRLWGDASRNVLRGLDGDDVLDGREGADVMEGGAGDDVYHVDNAGDVTLEAANQGRDVVLATISHTLGNHLEDLELRTRDETGTGNASNNRITSTEGENELFGLQGNDTLVSLQGDDLLNGGQGDDRYVLHKAQGEDYGLSKIIELANEGHDTVELAAAFGQRVGSGPAKVFALSDHVEDLDASKVSVDLVLTGNAENNLIQAGAGSDVVLGMEGDDRLFGGSSRANRAFQSDKANTVAYQRFMGGQNWGEKLPKSLANLLQDFDLTLNPDDIDPDYRTEFPAWTVNAQGQRIWTPIYAPSTELNLNNDFFYENLSLYNLTPDDYFLIDASGMVSENGAVLSNFVTEFWEPRQASERTWDYLSTTYGVRNQIEPGQESNYVVFRGAFVMMPNTPVQGGRIGWYSNLDWWYDNNDLSQAPVLYWPKDRLPFALEAIFGELDALDADTLDGGSGNDWLDGQAGNDHLIGGDGDDVLIGGLDEYVERLVKSIDFQATEGQPPTRAELAGYLLSNDDWLEGGSGADTLQGGSGNDLLDGGTGRDQMDGGTGDDVFIVDGQASINANGGAHGITGLNLCAPETRFGMDRSAKAAWVTDAIVERDGEGFDTVNASASVNLSGQSVEVVNLLGSGAAGASSADLDATTGAGSQRLNGNLGHNRLDGGAGADVMAGGAGNDTYIVDDLGDQIIEAADQGIDTVRTTLNNYTLAADLEGLVLEGNANLNGTGNAANNVLIGNTGANTLSGGNGADTLAGWRGNDRLLGGAGDDIYAFSRGDGVDHIADNEGNNRLHFSGDLNRADLSYAWSGNDLVITVAGGDVSQGGTVILENWGGSAERVNTVTFCGGGNFVLSESMLNRAPVAVADAAGIFEDGSVISGNVLSNDSDPDGDTLQVINTGIHSNAFGTLTLSTNGAYTYALNNSNSTIQALAASRQMTQTFAYTASDGKPAGALQASADLTITIIGVNDGPVARGDLAAVSEDGTVTATGNVLTNDSDVDVGDVLSAANAGTYQGTYGSLVLQANGGYSYSLNNTSSAVQSLRAGQQVSDVFTVTTSDGTASANANLTITVTGSNDGPVARGDTAAVAEDGIISATGNVLSNDSDVDAGTVLSVANAGTYQGIYGQLVLQANGSYAYTLANSSSAVQSLRFGQQVTDVFTLQSTDGIATAASSLTLTVTGSNDGPVVQADAASVSEDGIFTATGNVLTNDSDVDAGTVLQVTMPGNLIGQYGTLQLQANGSYTYTLNNTNTAVQGLRAGQQVQDIFAYTASDGMATSASQLVVTLTGSNDGPVARGDLAAVAEDGIVTATGNVLTNDSDVDAGDVLSVANAGTYQGTYGNLILQANGSYSYALNNSSNAVQSLRAGQQVSDVFTVTTSDGTASANANLTITVTGSNDTPTLQTVIADQSAQANQVFTLDLPDTTFQDIDQGDVLSYNVRLANGSALPSWLSFNPTGLIFTGTPPQALAGQSLDIQITATDRMGASASDVFRISVGGVTGLNLVGTCRDDRLVGGAGNDTLDGREGSDTMIGGVGDDLYYVDQARSHCEPGDIVTEYLNQGYDRVISRVDYVLPQHVEALTLAGSSCIDGTGNTLDNWLTGNGASNTLDGKEGNDLISAGSGDDCVYGGAGNDILEGQDGNDWLEGGDGRDALFGGAGNDTLKSNNGRGFLAGGRGNDALYAGTEATEIGFNKGDGCDVLYPSGSSPITLSLGGGIRYEDISIRRSGSDLYMDFNSQRTDSLRVVGYYNLSSNSRPNFTLQMLTEASGTFNANSSDVLRDDKAELFDGTRLIRSFDTAYAANSSLRRGNPWAVMNSLLDAHLGGSDTAALGGDLAYQFGSQSSSSLAGMGMAAAGAVIADAAFATGWQTLNRPVAQTSGPRLAG
jgi:trimeric autotransporter adhesin